MDSKMCSDLEKELFFHEGFIALPVIPRNRKYNQIPTAQAQMHTYTSNVRIISAEGETKWMLILSSLLISYRQS